MKVLQKSPVAYEEARSCLLFDPDEHPGKRLKASFFNVSNYGRMHHIHTLQPRLFHVY